MKVLLIDGNYFLHRSMNTPYFREVSHRGNYTGGVYGFLQNLRTAAHYMRGHKVLVCWDSAHSPRRLRIHPGYKGNKRDVDPIVIGGREIPYKEAFPEQMMILNTHIFPFLGVGSLTIPMSEADDVIGYISRNYTSIRGVESVTIATDDRDYIPMVREGVCLYRPIAGEYITCYDTEPLGGLTPLSYLYYKCFTGDSSDNIPGVKGIGDKKAKKILFKCQSVLSGSLSEDFNVIDATINSEGGDVKKSWYASVDTPYSNTPKTGWEVFRVNHELMDTSYEYFCEGYKRIIGSIADIIPDFQGELKVSEKFYNLGFEDCVRNISQFTRLFS